MQEDGNAAEGIMNGLLLSLILWIWIWEVLKW